MPAVNRLRNYNGHSGGFPHSDIHGSKPVPGSPWLNAGYHVLHRLLLPRHPPNALLALDLIRKEQGRAGSCSHPFPSRSRTTTLPRSPRGHRGGCVLDLEQYRLRGRTPDAPALGSTSDTDVFSLNDVNLRPTGRSSPPQPKAVGSMIRSSVRKSAAQGPHRRPRRARMVGRDGLEPSTSRLSGVRSNHLSYRPILAAIRPGLRPRSAAWWSLSGSNR